MSFLGRGRSCKVIKKIKEVIKNYLWYEKEQVSCTRVAWVDCCVKKRYGGTGLVNFLHPHGLG